MKPRGRPKKTRLVQGGPRIAQFSPRGRPGRPDEVELTVDQFEAIRLADYKGLEQRQACKLMGISRPTFTRVLMAARKKVADGLVNGKIIKIGGGEVRIG
ncbi:DUF134 domain-containing protein [Candidatus Omnitrophota bacterium]